MPLSWNEIKDRALKFSKSWADAKDEKSEAQRFWIDFFDIFGFTKQRVFAFEHAINKQGNAYKGNHGWIDLLWPGVLAYVRAAHPLHALNPLDAENVPTPQPTHEVLPALGWYVPAGQGTQPPMGATDALLNVPAVQLAHTRFDVAVGDTASYSPAPQSVSAVQARFMLVAVQLPARCGTGRDTATPVPYRGAIPVGPSATNATPTTKSMSTQIST